MNPLGQQILKDVSRSFYLSMRLLPKAMREPVSLGYLLARASDTIADTPGLDAGLRAEMLGDFEGLLRGADRVPWLNRLAGEIVPHQRHTGEKRLLENMAGVLAWLDALAAAPGAKNGAVKKRQHGAILTVMQHILRGQKLDIRRFELRDDFRVTQDAELEEYCYLVAGCVGEFWTEIGAVSLRRFCKADSARMHRWGANYGKALQLVNILRDLPNDLKAGRCYLPGMDPADSASVRRESARWRLRARDLLQDGVTYTDALTHRRTRMATALPGMIAGRTLDLLDQADWKTLEAGVKVSRREVYRCAWDALFV